MNTRGYIKTCNIFQTSKSNKTNNFRPDKE